MLAECITAFSDIQEYYVFLALCISKTNHRTTELKVSIKIENTKGLNPIQDAYATMTKLSTVVSYLKKIPKNKNHVTHPDISIFSPEISKFCYIKKSIYRLHFSA